ncbi:ATP-dependent Clp protease adapter ClpS [uncultured Mailhella sp.]|uniref:ATP-dependent Clp protease adapter ClpS n=1 Tax=uncultured Mailhella sp. TaxID=1981031 RepID=UPI002616F919|nr:ATP-dependent Clp protease adapter ClpS [uncultured Mailhella sp.]
MSEDIRPEDGTRIESGAALEEELKEPALFRVILHNDDYTTMEFVVRILREVFRKTEAEAEAIMLSVHQKGTGLCGVYPREIAEFRVGQVTSRARSAGFPLLCTMEKE